MGVGCTLSLRAQVPKQGGTPPYSEIAPAYVYVYTCVYIDIHIHMCREREREREPESSCLWYLDARSRAPTPWSCPASAASDLLLSSAGGVSATLAQSSECRNGIQTPVVFWGSYNVDPTALEI